MIQKQYDNYMDKTTKNETKQNPMGIFGANKIENRAKEAKKAKRRDTAQTHAPGKVLYLSRGLRHCLSVLIPLLYDYCVCV